MKSIGLIKRCLFLNLLLPIASIAYGEILTLRYDDAESNFKSIARVRFERDLYKLLPHYTKEGQKLHFIPEQSAMSLDRILHELSRGKYVNLFATPALKRKDAPGILVPIPIMKGLLGYRHLIIHRDTLKKLGHNVLTLESLKHFSIGQGVGWSENRLYQGNGFNLFIGMDLASLFNMLANKRFDILPLGVLETQHEMTLRPHKNIIIHPDILLYYSFPITFYVSKNEPALADFLTHALEAMAKDGTLDRILRKHFSEAIDVITTSKKRIIHLPNPYIHEDVPLSRQELWF